MPTQVITLIVVGAIMFLVIGGLAFLSHYYTLDGIKSKTVGDGQHGTARWATKQEIRQTYAHVPFEPELWRKGEHLPEKQGLVLGCEGPKDHVTALVDTDDIHAMVTAASGAGKTAFFLYPNIEYALAIRRQRQMCIRDRIPRATCSAIMPVLPRTATDTKSPCWICVIPPARTATTCFI